MQPDDAAHQEARGTVETQQPTGMEEQVKTAIQNEQRIYWHREVPPLAADAMAEHTLEAVSRQVAGMLVHRDELWSGCYDDLMARAAARLIQEMARLGGDCAHVHAESITPKHDPATGTSWLHGRFTYMLYRLQRPTA